MIPEREFFEAAGEDDVVIEIAGVGYTKREFVLAISDARRRAGLSLPECAHDDISPRDGLCLGCGEITAAPESAEQWVRWEHMRVVVNIEELGDMLAEHTRLLTPMMPEAVVPPDGRSTPGRSAPTREPSDTDD